MLFIEKTETYGWEAAIRGMRNPKNSWDKADTVYGVFADGTPVIGKNDKKLMTTLAGAGSVHGKFMRMITVTMDVTAPLYWWKEFDTYKVGTVADSCSTMHKIQAKEFSLEDFSCEHLFSHSLETMQAVIDNLNLERDKFLLTNDKDCWWQMIQLLPSAYNQKRTIQLNYEVLRGIYIYRKNHKLDEWHTFCHWIESLPYSELITGGTTNGEA